MAGRRQFPEGKDPIFQAYLALPGAHHSLEVQGSSVHAHEINSSTAREWLAEPWKD